MKRYTQILPLLTIFCCLTLTPATAQNKSVRKNSTAKNASAALVKNQSTNAEPANEKEPSDDEKTMFEAAQAESNPFQRIELFKAFLAKFPRTSLKMRAQESIVAARADYGDELMRTGDPAGGKEQFLLAIKESPAQVSDKLFSAVISRIPTNLFFRGEQAAAFEAAKRVEEKAGDNAERLLSMAQFYLITENADDTRRLAARAAELKPDSANAQITLGLANRIGFRLESAAQAFRRALELDPKSAAAKRGLADALRGIGQADESAKLYREILQENSTDEAARGGLVLSLFATGKRTEAESEMNAALAANPKNFQLLATAAYWYAANGDGAKAVELGRKATEIEPRYTWSHIALARGLILEKQPLEAERALLIAKQYGNFPTLDYELANARFAAGFYDEAAADLRRSFGLKNGQLSTKLAGRATQNASNFVELLALERRAAILQPVAADTEENAERLKRLLAFSNTVNSEKKDETAIAAAAKDFVTGDDAASIHRKLYAANQLLKQRIDLPQVVELTQAATDGVEAGVQVPAATAAVMAEELYEPRQIAASQGRLVTVPEVQRNVLTSILRGRIEELAGWALYNQDRGDEAVIRLKRAVGILPINSAWWRSSQWRLGAALEKTGKEREALEAYVKSYRSAPYDTNRRAIIEALYTRLNGSNKGLDIKLGEAVAQSAVTANPVISAQQAPAAFKNPLPDVIAKINDPTRPETRTSVTRQPENIRPEPAPVAPPTPEIETAKVEKSISEPTPEAVTVQRETQTAKVETVSPAPESETKGREAVEPQPTPEAKIEKSEIVAETAKEEPAKPQPVPESEVKSGLEQTAKQSGSLSSAEETPRVRVVLIDRLKNTVTEIPPSGEGKTEVAGAVTSENSSESNPNVKIVSQLEGAPAQADRPRVSCAIWTSQDAISLSSAGGKASLLVGIEGLKSVDDLKVTVSNPAHIEVKTDKEIDVAASRVLYEIHSISEFRGEYTITFESSCGKKTVKVRVR